MFGGDEKRCERCYRERVIGYSMVRTDLLRSLRQGASFGFFDGHEISEGVLVRFGDSAGQNLWTVCNIMRCPGACCSGTHDKGERAR